MSFNFKENDYVKFKFDCGQADFLKGMYAQIMYISKEKSCKSYERDFLNVYPCKFCKGRYIGLLVEIKGYFPLKCWCYTNKICFKKITNKKEIKKAQKRLKRTKEIWIEGNI